MRIKQKIQHKYQSLKPGEKLLISIVAGLILGLLLFNWGTETGKALYNATH